MEPSSEAHEADPLSHAAAPHVGSGLGSAQTRKWSSRSTSLGKRNTITWYFPSLSSNQDQDNRSLEEKTFDLPETAGATESSDLPALRDNVEIEEQLVPLAPDFLNVAEETKSCLAEPEPCGRAERGTKRSRSTNSPELNIEVSNVRANTEIMSLNLTKTEEQSAKKAKTETAPLVTSKIFSPDQSKTLPEHLSALRKEIEDLIQHVVLTKLEAMERSLADLWNWNKRLTRTLLANGINHVTHDELQDDDSSGKAMNIDLKESVGTLHPTSKDQELLKQVHPERIRNVSDTFVPSKNLAPTSHDAKAATGMRNWQSDLNAAEVPSESTPADILLKKKAFCTDFGLPLSPRNGYTVKINSLVGDEPIASEYTNVVADGESIWLELPEKAINLTNFRRRQLTSSRQYWTLNGVTLHQHLKPFKISQHHYISFYTLE